MLEVIPKGCDNTYVTRSFLLHTGFGGASWNKLYFIDYDVSSSVAKTEW